jgi:hypothetical protein
LLKGDVWKNSGNTKRASKFYDKVRQKHKSGGKGRSSFEYTEALKKMGEVHRMRG